MIPKMSFWGVGPSIMLPSLAYIVPAGLATLFWPDVCLIQSISHGVFLAAGGLLLVLGLPLLFVAGRALVRTHQRDELLTTGVYALSRNPIYAIWIFLIFPGLMLLARSWPLLLTPIFTYLLFKVRIRREDEYLEARFGESYRKYRREVGELLPRLKRRIRQ
ncbi:MAG: isoprenylcysteine carboxylmethyltransferase family protein [Pirellulales bacterium]|nr:isoprenylcysteine carboxylmethyltransferase family protein [Pirellulales bacterium]